MFAVVGRKQEQIARAAEPLMEPGEVVEATGMAVLGKFELGKSAALAAVTAVASLGLVSVISVPKPQPVVLTTRRLLVLGIKTGIIDSAESRIVAEIPRSELRATPSKRVMLYHAVDLTDVQGNKVTRMKFSMMDGGDAKRFAQGLGAGLA